MRVSLYLPLPLRSLAEDKARLRLEIAGTRVADLRAALAAKYPALAEALWDDQGQLREHVTLYAGEQDARHLGNADAPLAEEIYVIVPVAI